MLQRRLSAERRINEVVRQHPAHFVAFDLLPDGRGVELLDQTHDTASETGTPTPPRTAPAGGLPADDDLQVAHGWLAELGVAGVEGVVVKPIGGRYQPGAPGWTKVRARATADYIIGGVIGSMIWPTSLLLGRFDKLGVLRYAGQTHPIRATQRRELTTALRGIPSRTQAQGIRGHAHARRRRSSY